MTRPDHDHPIVRNSSLELLRIVAMLMIVAFHFFRHGGFDFPEDSFTVNRIYYQFLLMFGNFGNAVFVLISGYFLILSDRLKPQRLINLWLRMVFYSAAFYAASVLIGRADFGAKGILSVLRPVTKFRWWLASTYIILYLIHPYLNMFLKRMTKEEYRKFLAAVFCYWCIIPMLSKSNFGANALINFMCLYSLAGYFRLWADDVYGKKYILYGAIFAVMNFVMILLLDAAVMKFPVLSEYAVHFTGLMNCQEILRPLVVLTALSLVLGFKGFDVTQRKIVNVIAATSFGVYLIHDGAEGHFLWREVFRNASFQDSPYLIPYSLSVILTVYISCTVIELIRSKIFRTITRGYLS